MKKTLFLSTLAFLYSCENKKTIHISYREEFKLQIVRESKSDDYTGGILEFELKGSVQQRDTLFLEIIYPNSETSHVEIPIDSGIVKSQYIQDWYSDKAIFCMKYNPKKKGNLLLSYKYY